VVCFRQKGFIEQHEDHEDDDNEHRHDDAGPTEGSHAVMYDSDSPGCCDCTNGDAWKEDWYVQVPWLYINM
jgi:hypothetical protein